MRPSSVQIFDTSPLRARPDSRRRPTPRPAPEVDVSALSATAGGLSVLTGLAALVLLALPALGLSDLLPGAYNRAEVPVMAGSETLEEVDLPSAALLALPAVGALVAMLGVGPSRGRGVPILPVLGILTCALALASWWGQLLWFSMTYGDQGIGLP
jgi:hypothetical protein